MRNLLSLREHSLSGTHIPFAEGEMAMCPDGNEPGEGLIMKQVYETLKEHKCIGVDQLIFNCRDPEGDAVLAVTKELFMCEALIQVRMCTTILTVPSPSHWSCVGVHMFHFLTLLNVQLRMLRATAL
jgi:hypothetical protein